MNRESDRTALMKAVATPLASIFGSGFLVIVPILAGVLGSYSTVAMAAVCLVAYLVGAVIRHNIRHAEPELAGKPGEATLSLERASDLALVIAYVISVCLYLHILSSFVLGGFGLDSAINEDLMTSAIILAIVVVGVVKGLGMLEGLEDWALAITIAVILLLLAGFAVHDWNAWQTPQGIVPPVNPDQSPWKVLTVVAGTLIVVQGFETPRYLGQLYPAETRVRASRWAQIISTVVYIGFVALAMPLLHVLNGHYDDNSLIALAGAVSGLLVAPLIVTAALSQFSAAVADTLTATGNLEEITQGHLKAKWAYIIVGGGALALAWSADTLTIVAIASRAFAFYYLLQCFVAISITSSWGRRCAFLALAGVLAFITVFAVPVS